MRVLVVVVEGVRMERCCELHTKSIEATAQLDDLHNKLPRQQSQSVGQSAGYLPGQRRQKSCSTPEEISKVSILLCSQSRRSLNRIGYLVRM